MRGLRARRPRGRPRKTLEQLVADRSFLARRHSGLLAGAPVDDPTLAALQQLYRQAGDDRRRRRVALQFEKIVRVGEPDAARKAPDVEPAVEREEPLEAAETYAEMTARIWRQPAPWRERGVSPEEAHRHSNVESVPGSFAHPFSWPPVGE